MFEVSGACVQRCAHSKKDQKDWRPLPLPVPRAGGEGWGCARARKQLGLDISQRQDNAIATAAEAAYMTFFYLPLIGLMVRVNHVFSSDNTIFFLGKQGRMGQEQRRSGRRRHYRNQSSWPEASCAVGVIRSSNGSSREAGIHVAEAICVSYTGGTTTLMV